MKEKEKNKSKSLGQDPFDASFKWIESTAKKEEKKPEVPEEGLQGKPGKQNITDNTIRQTYHMDKDIMEKIKKYAYIERLKISEVVNIALREFFVSKKFD